MHEQSLVRTLLRQVDDIRRFHDARHVVEVRVEVGPLTGVEPLLLAAAFEQLAPKSPAAGAKIVIDEASLVAECLSCKRKSEVRHFVFRCPECGGNVRVIRGDKFQLVSVTLSERSSETGDAARESHESCAHELVRGEEATS